MAANSPIAVANSASEMPGATTASDELSCAPIWKKLFMMPQTVPNRPTNGATAPVVAMSLITRTGTRWETRRDAGIVNLLQLMIVRGTSTMDGGQIVEAADRMGGSIDAYGDSDYAEVLGTALSRYTAGILDLVADIARSLAVIPVAAVAAS